MAIIVSARLQGIAIGKIRTGKMDKLPVTIHIIRKQVSQLNPTLSQKENLEDNRNMNTANNRDHSPQIAPFTGVSGKTSCKEVK